MSIPTLAEPIPERNVTIKQNGVFRMSLCIVERDDDDVATVIDTTGWEAVLQVRAEPKTTSPVLLEASTDNGRIAVGITGDLGEEVNIDIKVPASITAALTWFGCAGYDLLVIYPGGDQDYLLQGQALIMPAYSWGTP